MYILYRSLLEKLKIKCSKGLPNTYTKIGNYFLGLALGRDTVTDPEPDRNHIRKSDPNLIGINTLPILTRAAEQDPDP
jgi:hypothetical protein